MRRFEGKTVVISGGAAGIGEATAHRLAGEGAAVMLVDIADEVGEGVAEQIRAEGGRAAFTHCDVAAEGDWQAVRDRAHREFGPVDILVSNAYMLATGAAHEVNLVAWDRQIAVNLTALYIATRTFIADLQQRNGCIVATSSVHALFGLPGHPAYAASKGGINALVRQLAVEYGPRVRVNTVLPGPIITATWGAVDRAGREQAGRGTALRRLGRAEEVANVVAFLASAEASYVTGASVLVDGGWSVQKDAP